MTDTVTEDGHGYRHRNIRCSFHLSLGFLVQPFVYIDNLCYKSRYFRTKIDVMIMALTVLAAVTTSRTKNTFL